MEEIRSNKKKPEQIIEKAKEKVSDIIKKFDKNLKKIGSELLEAYKDTLEKQSTVGKCPECKKGTLVIKRGKFGFFVACDQYPDCKATFKLPPNALIKVTDKVCSKCGNPIVLVIRRGKRPQEMCIMPDCPSKNLDEDGKKIKIPKKIDKKCPKCKSPLVLRKSFYGEFIGCSNYPKCRYTEKIE